MNKQKKREDNTHERNYLRKVGSEGVKKKWRLGFKTYQSGCEEKNR